MLVERYVGIRLRIGSYIGIQRKRKEIVKTRITMCLRAHSPSRRIESKKNNSKGFSERELDLRTRVVVFFVAGLFGFLFIYFIFEGFGGIRELGKFSYAGCFDYKLSAFCVPVKQSEILLGK